jgi:ATP-dependent Zn protease
VRSGVIKGCEGVMLMRIDSYTRKEYNAMIDVALGGRAAEEMIFGREDVTSGCSSDLQRATDVATRMIRVSVPSGAGADG